MKMFEQKGEQILNATQAREPAVQDCGREDQRPRPAAACGQRGTAGPQEVRPNAGSGSMEASSGRAYEDCHRSPDAEPDPRRFTLSPAATVLRAVARVRRAWPALRPHLPTRRIATLFALIRRGKIRRWEIDQPTPDVRFRFESGQPKSLMSTWLAMKLPRAGSA